MSLNITRPQRPSNSTFASTFGLFYSGMPEPVQTDKKYRGTATIEAAYRDDPQEVIRNMQTAMNEFADCDQTEMSVYDGTIEIMFYSPEEDDEFAERLASYQEARRQHEQRDYQQYLELKARFEGREDATVTRAG